MACVICKGLRHGDPTTEIKAKGRKTLVKFSLLRKDGLEEVFQNIETLVIHNVCYRRYTCYSTNKHGEIKPNTLNLETHKPKEKVNFVVTLLPSNSKKKDILPEDLESAQHYVPEQNSERTDTIKTNDNVSFLLKSTKQTGLLNAKTELQNEDTYNSATHLDNSVIKDCLTTYEDVSFQNIEDNENCKVRHSSSGKFYRKSDKKQDDSYYDDPSKPFPFHHLCFICAKDISDEYIVMDKKLPEKSRNKVVRVAKPNTQQSILKILSKHDIPKHQVIIQRIKDVDLRQENAGYHSKCLGRISYPLTGRPIGRKPCVKITAAMETIFRYIEEGNLTNYTACELMKLVDDSNEMTMATMLTRLDERYRGKIYFTKPGKKTVINVIRDPNINIQIEGQNNSNKKRWGKFAVVAKKEKPGKKRNSSFYDDENLNEDPPQSPCSDLSAADTERDTNTFCHVCFSRNRQLAALGEYADVYRSLCGDIYQEYSEQLLLCWECRASLKHALCFQKRVRMSQQLLNEMQRKCLSTMSVATPASSIISYKPEKLHEVFLGDEDTKLYPEITVEHPENTKEHPEVSEKHPEDWKKYPEDSNIYLEDTEPYPNDTTLNQEDDEKKEEVIPMPVDDTRGIDDFRWSDDSDVDDSPAAKRPRRSTRTKAYDKPPSVKSVEDDNSSSSESHCSDWDPSLEPNKRTKTKNSTITVHCGVKVLDFDADSIVEYVAIEPHEVYLWREKERHSTYFTNLERKCETCITSVEDDHDILYHSKNNHYVCDICEVTSPSKPGLDSHLAGHCYLFRCAICGYQCCNQHHMRAHVEMHRKEYECLECGHSFRSLDIFEEHYKELHRGADCDHCGKHFSHKLNLEKHIQRLHMPHVCTICNITFEQYPKLQNHIDAKHHISRTESAYCVVCDIQFDNEKLFKRHLVNSVKHARERGREPRKKPTEHKEKHKCPECPSVYSRINYLRSHYDFVHAKKVNFYCLPCDKAFTMKGGYNRHMRSHAGFKPPKNKFCEVCGRGFATIRILRHHMRTHTGERPHACELCPARFAQSTALQSHKKRLHKQH